MNSLGEVMATRMFFRCQHINDLELFVWLTTRQIYMADDEWIDERVTACEDRDGEMIAHDVRIADLSNFKEI